MLATECLKFLGDSLAEEGDWVPFRSKDAFCIQLVKTGHAFCTSRSVFLKARVNSSLGRKGIPGTLSGLVSKCVWGFISLYETEL